MMENKNVIEFIETVKENPELLVIAFVNISARQDRRCAPKLLGIDDIHVGDLVWIEENNGDIMARTIGFAECTDDGTMARRNKEALEFYGCRNFITLSASGYGKNWRCWDDRPGVSQRWTKEWKD